MKPGCNDVTQQLLWIFFFLQPFLCLYVLHMKAISIMLHSDGNEIILMAFAQLSEKYN